MIDKIDRITRLKSRGYHSLGENGLRGTISKGLTIIQQNQPFDKLDPYFRPSINIKTGHLFQSESPPSLLKAKLISEQYTDGEFGRYDIFVFIAGLEGDQELYSKVATYYNHLYSLDSPILKGLDEFCPVHIQSNGELIDIGLFAKHLLDNSYDVVPVKVSSSSVASKITRNDLSKILDKEELKKIDDIATKILKTSGYLFQSIIWPPGLQFQDDIENRFSQRGNLIDVVNIELGNSFASFVDDIYLTQFSGRTDLANKKEKIMRGVRQKQEIMSKYGTQVKVLFLEVPDPKIREESAVMSETKLSCREDLRNHLDEEKSSEIIVHSTDDFVHNLTTINVLNRYTEMARDDSSPILVDRVNSQ